MKHLAPLVTLLLLMSGLGCEGAVERPAPPPNDGIYGYANGCYAMDAAEPRRGPTGFLAPTPAGDAFEFAVAEVEEASRFRMRPSDLGTYLFYDQEGQYLVSEDDGALMRQAELMSDLLLIDDDYVSGAEWEIEESVHDPVRFQLRHRRTGQYLTTTGLTEDERLAAVITLYPQTDCAEFPELTVDTEGEVEPRQWPDGDVFGVVETHSHLFTNYGFGGGGIVHGSPFHRLGVEHALPDCALFHGEEGRQDLMGFAFDTAGLDLDPEVLLTAFITGETPSFNHFTAGYPDFTQWPSAHDSSTHQAQYYRWLERAYMGGLRLLVQHGTSNSVMCDLIVGNRIQQVRYSCNDMVAIDRQIEETYALERYIDAQHGGPGEGWFRVVTSPAQAREVINQGKLAVLLGIEVSNLFDCFLTPPEGVERCDEAEVVAQLDRYYDLGVRVLFPVHKYDNGFSAGDGQKAVIQLGNFINTGHYSNFTEDCPDVPTVFDHGDVTFGGINMPRPDYLAPPAVDMSGFAEGPIPTLAPYIDAFMDPALEGDYCQSTGLTSLGEFLIREMMTRGMILEVDHLPRRSYLRAFEMLEEIGYPAAGTHGTNFDGRIYALGGVSKSGFGRCHDPDTPGTSFNRFRSRFQLIADNGGYPAEGFGFDLNGFAGAAGPRFGDNSVCSTPQENPITYPFTSYAGDVTFEEPHVGNRTLDFNTEGMVHIGMMPELIEDARHDGVTDEELEPLFRSAEGYLRMWELAETRAAELRP